MTEIASVINPTFIQPKHPVVTSDITAAHIAQQYTSSLSSSETTFCMKIGNCFLGPFKFIGGLFATIGKWILDYVFCFCKCSSNKIDYAQVKKVVINIIACLKETKPDYEKTYPRLLHKLTADAIAEFKDLLGHKLAEGALRDKNPGTPPTEIQINEHFAKNKDKLKIDDLLANEKNPILLEAFNEYLEVVGKKLK